MEPALTWIGAGRNAGFFMAGSDARLPKAALWDKIRLADKMVSKFRYFALFLKWSENVTSVTLSDRSDSA